MIVARHPKLCFGGAMNDMRHLILLSYGVIILLGWGLAVAPPQSSSEIAAWVQGVGTVGGAGIAAWVGTLPIRQRARERRAVRAGFAEDVSSVARSVLHVCERAQASLDARNRLEMEVNLRVLAELELGELVADLLKEPRHIWPTRTSYFYGQTLLRALKGAMSNRLLQKFEALDPSHINAAWAVVQGELTLIRIQAELMLKDAQGLSEGGRRFASTAGG